MAAEQGPREVIAETVDQVLVVLNDGSLPSHTRRRRIEEIAYTRFDFTTMSKLVVARHWKTFSAEQQRELVDEFKSFLANTYGERIGRFNQEQVEVVGEREEQRGDVTVLTRIVGGDYAGAEVDYRLRRSKHGWRVIDVKVEGISIVLNYRDQFKSILGRKGPEGLLDTLRRKNAERAAVHES